MSSRKTSMFSSFCLERHWGGRWCRLTIPFQWPLRLCCSRNTDICCNKSHHHLNSIDSMQLTRPLLRNLRFEANLTHFIHVCLVPMLKEYFQIDCCMRMSKSIFLFTVAGGCPGIFSNWLSQADVQDYFQIDCHTRGSRTIFLLTVARGCPGVFSNWLSHAVVQEYFQFDCHTRVSRTIF